MMQRLKNNIVLVATGVIIWLKISLILYAVLLTLSRFIPVLSGIVSTVFLIFFTAGITYILLMIFSILAGKELIPFISTHPYWMGFLVPVYDIFAKKAGINTDDFVHHFLSIHNKFVFNAIKGKDIQKIMILLPHCLQLDACGLKITSDIRNCKKCGKCVISGFLDISDEYCIDIFVSTGGTLARKAIKDRRPQLVIAVACERDLLSGIKDTLKMPVIGVFNERPNGPCYNTTVNLELIKGVIRKLKDETGNKRS